MIGWIIVIFILIVMAAAMVGVVLAVFAVVLNRKDRSLRSEAEAHRRILESTYDHVWDTFKNQAHISERFRTAFTDIYPNLINQNIDNDMLLNWLIDCNPDFDPECYPELLDVIEQDRQHFVVHQHRMLTIIEEHRQMLTNRFYAKLVKNKAAIVYVPIDTRYDRWGKRL